MTSPTYTYVCGACGRVVTSPTALDYAHAACSACGRRAWTLQTATALDAVPPAAVAAITTPTTPEAVQALVRYLRQQGGYVEAKTVLYAMAAHLPVWRTGVDLDTPLRALRVIRDAAVAAGYPVATSNRGYILASAAGLIEAAERCERQAAGLMKRAASLRALAARD